MIKLNSADKTYNKGRSAIHAVNRTTLTLPDTGMTAIFGKSGCGKSTLLNLIGGLDSPDSGSIEVMGEDISKNTDLVRNKYIGYIFQNYNLERSMTVYENLAAALRLCGAYDESEINEHVMWSLRRVGMTRYAKRYPDALSGGQQQRVAIARAIIKKPAIILADEPTGNLDSENTLIVMDMLKELSKECLVLLVTHEEELVSLYCDRIIEIIDGSVVSDRENVSEKTAGRTLTEEPTSETVRYDNTVYLDELENITLENGIAKLDLYGIGEEKLELTVILRDGRYYIRSSAPICLIDGSEDFRIESNAPAAAADPVPKHTHDGQELSDVKAPGKFKTGNKYGSLFNFRRALTDSARYCFGKSAKRGRWLQRAILFILAALTVLTSAVFAASADMAATAVSAIEPNELYVRLDGDGYDDYDDLINALGTNGIEDMRLIFGSAMMSDASISFFPGSFVSSEPFLVTGTGCYEPMSLIPENAAIICGTAESDDYNDIVITDALAKQMIRNSPASYINEIPDLLDLVAFNTDQPFRIIGVVRSEVAAFYMNDLMLAYIIHDSFMTHDTISAVYPVSMYDVLDYHPARGEVAVYRARKNDPKYSGSIQMFGKEFTVAKRLQYYNYENDYVDYLNDFYGIQLKMPAAYITSEKNNGSDKTELQLVCEWYYDVYLEHVYDYIDMIASVTPFQSDRAYTMNKVRGDSKYYVFFAPDQNKYIYNALYDIVYEDVLSASAMFRSEKGYYPTDKAELEDYMKNMIGTYVDFDYSLAQYSQKLWTSLSAETQPEYEKYASVNESRFDTGRTVILMNDEDYKEIRYAIPGREQTGIYYSGMAESIYRLGNRPDFANGVYLLVHSSDMKETEKFLRDQYGDKVMDHGEYVSFHLGVKRLIMIAVSVGMALLMILMALSAFFIMRSVFMGRVREIGIYRAVGVSSKNMVFRYLIETLMLISASALPGFLVTSAIVCMFNSAFDVNGMFYYPLWVAITVLIVLYAVCVLFGLLPVVILLKKKPAEIISRYDI